MQDNELSALELVTAQRTMLSSLVRNRWLKMYKYSVDVDFRRSPEPSARLPQLNTTNQPTNQSITQLILQDATFQQQGHRRCQQLRSQVHSHDAV
jgi:hypothetical protein